MRALIGLVMIAALINGLLPEGKAREWTRLVTGLIGVRIVLSLLYGVFKQVF